jgi:homeobox-leucine zipper protein
MCGEVVLEWWLRGWLGVVVQPGPDAIGIIAISHGCVGIAARACGLVALDASKVAEVMKDRPGWQQDCRRMEILGALPTGNGGTIELLYTQVRACGWVALGGVCEG